eukprot:jgi/Ulvmu1/11910/UM081_0069.1
MHLHVAMSWQLVVFLAVAATASAKFLDASIDPFAGNTNFLVQVINATDQIRSSGRIMRMADAHGKHYECAIPERESLGSQLVQPSLQDAQAIMLRLKNSGQCFRRSEGYWAYEVCPGSHVRQYHMNGLVVEQEFILGVFHGEEQQLEISTAGPSGGVIMSEKYTRGQVCDLTGHDRTVSLHYMCSHAGLTFTSIEEMMSCQYVAMLGMPDLCELAHAKESSLHIIECAPSEEPVSQPEPPNAEGSCDKAE